AESAGLERKLPQIKRVLRAVGRLGPVTASKIAEELGIKKTSVSPLLTKLKQSGAVIEAPQAHKEESLWEARTVDWEDATQTDTKSNTGNASTTQNTTDAGDALQASPPSGVRLLQRKPPSAGVQRKKSCP